MAETVKRKLMPDPISSQEGMDTEVRKTPMESPVYDQARFAKSTVVERPRPKSYASMNAPLTMPFALTSETSSTARNYEEHASYQSQVAPHQDPGRPFWVHQSPPRTDDSSFLATPSDFSDHQSSSSRLSLQHSLCHGRGFMATFDHVSESEHHTEPSRTLGSSRAPLHHPQYAPSSLALSRQTTRPSSHFTDRAPQPQFGQIAAYGNATGRGRADLTDSSENEDVVAKNEEWSTIPTKRKRSYKETFSSTHSQPFRLPGIFSDSSSVLKGKVNPRTPSYRSNDSATEVVVPLRRPKITLFQPSPPKPSPLD
ncbi:hypothetical protein QFC19_001943 [Naganishia cerealis]|uniref:Uncharacterized protein n=1 Tax=Naganishia cerealis TaxID=610337 RepID=A0ACC2WE91_9TREE|nr:hypothetical protein QFC19_001943 [Naganishia cerealis]